MPRPVAIGEIGPRQRLHDLFALFGGATNSGAKKEFETAENRALLRETDRPSTEIPQQASKHARRQGELCLLPPRARYWNRFHAVLAIKDQCAALRPQRTAGQGAFSIQAASKALRHLQ